MKNISQKTLLTGLLGIISRSQQRLYPDRWGDIRLSEAGNFLRAMTFPWSYLPVHEGRPCTHFIMLNPFPGIKPGVECQQCYSGAVIGYFIIFMK